LKSSGLAAAGGCCWAPGAAAAGAASSIAMAVPCWGPAASISQDRRMRW
jgi:hypothetical protein